MSAAKPDRRVQKTRQALQAALVALILEKGYEAVMVQDILDRANVGRSTFYAHYPDKDALLLERFESVQAAFAEHLQAVQGARAAPGAPAGPELNLPLFLLRYVEREHQVFQALLGQRGSGKHAAHLQRFLLQYIRAIIQSHAQAPVSPAALEIISQYLASGFIAPLVWWVDHDRPCSVDELYALMTRLITPGLKEVLGVSALWS